MSTMFIVALGRETCLALPRRVSVSIASIWIRVAKTALLHLVICMVQDITSVGVCLKAVAHGFVKARQLDAIVGDGAAGAEGQEPAHNPNVPGSAVARDHRLQ